MPTMEMQAMAAASDFFVGASKADMAGFMPGGDDYSKSRRHTPRL